MNDTHEDHLLIQIIKYGLNRHRFTPLELILDLKIKPDDVTYVKKLIIDTPERANENHIMYVIEARSNPQLSPANYSIDHSICTLLPTAIKYWVEHEEIRMARENANDAKRQASKANTVAMLALFITLIFGVIQTYITLFVNTPINASPPSSPTCRCNSSNRSFP